jgi:uncharacterized phage-associated protein
MVTSLDVAEYILQQKGPVTSMKLQKLVYYSQAWSLALEEEPIFNEPIEASPNGPVVKNLTVNPQDQSHVFTIPQGDPGRLTTEHKETIDAVLIYYGQKSAHWLMDKTHSETPWRKAREELSESGQGSGKTISFQAMKEYYSGLEEHC